MLANPNMTEKDALAAPYNTSEKAKDRGSTVHSIVEAFEHGNKLDTEAIPEEFQGYAKAFYRWVDQMKITILEHEQTIFSEKYKYAGTLDLLVTIGEDPRTYVIDVKTGKDIYAEAFMQISAYQNALAEAGKPIAGVGVILLGKDGEYKFQATEETATKFKGFLACKQIWESLNEEMLKKVGYLK
jgi:predicted RecB family nuclease